MQDLSRGHRLVLFVLTGVGILLWQPWLLALLADWPLVLIGLAAALYVGFGLDRDPPGPHVFEPHPGARVLCLHCGAGRSEHEEEI